MAARGVKWGWSWAAWAASWTVAPPALAQEMQPAPETLAVGDWKLGPVASFEIEGDARRDLDGGNRGMLFERSRIGIDGARGPIEVRLVLQDARALALAAGAAFVEGPSVFASTAFHEAWAAVQSASDRPSFLRAGRQEITWGEGRLLGAAESSPTGRSLDAVRARWVVRDADFEVLGALLEDPPVLPGDASAAPTRSYGELFGLRCQGSLDPLFSMEAYALARLAEESPLTALGAPSSMKGQTYTGALRVHGEVETFRWGLEGAYQVGRVDALGESRQAWAASAHAAQIFSHAQWTPSLGIGLSYASGDDGSGTYRAFDPILPDVRTFHGAMDVFAFSNEAEVSARASGVPFADAEVAVEYRYARLAEAGGAWQSAYLAPLGRTPKNRNADLGHEVDARFRVAPWAPVDVTATAALLILDEGARDVLVGAGQASAPHVSALGTLGARVAF